MLQNKINSLLDAKKPYKKFMPIDLNGETTYGICVVIHVGESMEKTLDVENETLRRNFVD